MKRSISVIIPSYNSFKTIEHTLNGLLAQPDGAIDEIIVVDSSSDDKTRELLLKFRSEKVKVVMAKAGPGTARNIGVKNSRGDILAFIDSDAYPDPDWGESIIKACDDGYMVGGGSISIPVFQRNRVIPLAQFFLQYNEYIDAGKARIKKFVPSVTMFCDRKIFEKFGGFPAIRAAEDVLFCLKVGKEMPVWFVPDIRVHHIFRKDVKSFLANQALLGKYIIIYRRINEPDAFYYKGFWPLLFLPGFMLIKLYRIIRRVFRSGPYLIFKFLYCFPVFVLGLLFWGIGFVKGVVTKGND